MTYKFAVNYERKMVSVEVDTIDIEYFTLGQILENITKSINEYGKDAKVSLNTYSYTTDTYYAINMMKPETDQQYNKRIAEEEKYYKQQEDRDAAEFKRLSEKFGTNK